MLPEKPQIPSAILNLAISMQFNSCLRWRSSVLWPVLSRCKRSQCLNWKRMSGSRLSIQ